MKISLLILTHKRHRDLHELLQSLFTLKKIEDVEIIVIDNDPDSKLEEVIRTKYPQVLYYRQETNKGVSGGRNAAIKLSTGDILVFIDDDALFVSPDVFSIIKSTIEKQPGIGCIAFRIRNQFNRKTLKREYPHPDLRTANLRKYVGYYVGAGHAIRRDVFQKVGLYPEEFIYGFEELELSYRMIAKGYKILYEPAIEVTHKSSPEGRVPQNTTIRYYMHNRLSISLRYLPMPYKLTSVIFWTLNLLKMAIQSNNLTNWFDGLKDVLKGYPFTKKQLSREAIHYIRTTHGRLWY